MISQIELDQLANQTSRRAEVREDGRVLRLHMDDASVRAFSWDGKRIQLTDDSEAP